MKEELGFEIGRMASSTGWIVVVVTVLPDVVDVVLLERCHRRGRPCEIFQSPLRSSSIL